MADRMYLDHLKRREFITLLGGAAAALPMAAWAQQTATPVIGLLTSLSMSDRPRIEPFHKGLNENGYSDGRNVAIEYRFAEGDYSRLPALATELVRRGVSVITTIAGTPTALAAKAATNTIPIVFAIGGDPVTAGLVNSLNKPGSNVTGVTFFTSPLAAKRLDMLQQLVPVATTIGVLINPDNPPSVLEGKSAPAAATQFGLASIVLAARTGSDIETAFASVVERRIDAIYVSADPLFFTRRAQLAALAIRHGVPAIYADREIVEAGGLISYGASRSDAYHQNGIYVARILRGAKPADLPVILPTKFETVLNLKTAKALGLTLSDKLLVAADKVIE
jgi:putative tryptophan/tyrosine transport system substrate-binding protein